MKQSLLIFCLLSAVTLSAQNFAPIGATWHYSESKLYLGAPITYYSIEAVADTVILGKVCRILKTNQTPDCFFNPFYNPDRLSRDAFVYEEDNVVYFYDRAYEQFQVFYDLNKQVGESWKTKIDSHMGINERLTDTLVSTVTAISEITLNNMTLTQMSISDTISDGSGGFLATYSRTIVERIGDMHYLFMLATRHVSVCDGRISEGLRCYEDAEFGLYETGLVPYCTYTAIETTRVTPEVEIYPNPTSDLVTLTVNDNAPLTAALTTITGQKVAEQAMTSRVEFSLATLPQGIYFIVLNQENRTIGSYKVVKQ